MNESTLRRRAEVLAAFGPDVSLEPGTLGGALVVALEVRDAAREAANRYLEEKRAALSAPTPRPLNAAMDNLSRLGNAAALAATSPAGDLIDRGLILLAELNKYGFDVVLRGSGDAHLHVHEDARFPIVAGALKTGLRGRVVAGPLVVYVDGGPWAECLGRSLGTAGALCAAYVDGCADDAWFPGCRMDRK